MDGAQWLFCREDACEGSFEQRRMIVAQASQCQSTHRNVRHPHGKQEEADTKHIVHASEATDSGV